MTVFLVGAENIVMDAHVFHLSKHGEFFSAFPDGTGEFFVDTKSSRDKTNAPARNTDIVINEIMYKPPDTQGKGEYVELFNRGKQTVNLNEWVLTGGIDFIFPRTPSSRPATTSSSPPTRGCSAPSTGPSTCWATSPAS